MEEKIDMLLRSASELCSSVSQLLLRSEERTLRVQEVYEKQTEVLTTLANENQAQRLEYGRYLDSLIKDRDKCREDYSHLVGQFFREVECMRKNGEKDKEIVQLLIDKLSGGTTINNQ